MKKLITVSICVFEAIIAPLCFAQDPIIPPSTPTQIGTPQAPLDPALQKHDARLSSSSKSLESKKQVTDERLSATSKSLDPEASNEDDRLSATSRSLQ